MRTGRTILRVLAVISAFVLVGWYVLHESGARFMSGSKSGRISDRALELNAADAAETVAPTTAESTPPPRVFMPGSKSKSHVLDEQDAQQLRLMSGSKSAAVFDSADVLPTTAPTPMPATQPVPPTTLPLPPLRVFPSSKSGRIFSPPPEPAAAATFKLTPPATQPFIAASVKTYDIDPNSPNKYAEKKLMWGSKSGRMFSAEDVKVDTNPPPISPLTLTVPSTQPTEYPATQPNNHP